MNVVWLCFYNICYENNLWLNDFFHRYFLKRGWRVDSSIASLRGKFFFVLFCFVFFEIFLNKHFFLFFFKKKNSLSQTSPFTWSENSLAHRVVLRLDDPFYGPVRDSIVFATFNSNKNCDFNETIFFVSFMVALLWNLTNWQRTKIRFCQLLFFWNVNGFIYIMHDNVYFCLQILRGDANHPTIQVLLLFIYIYM